MEEHNRQNMILENRKKLNITGVKDVARFSEDKIVLSTLLGTLNVEGEGLHINSFVQETGELHMEGSVDALIYQDNPGEKGGFLEVLDLDVHEGPGAVFRLVRPAQGDGDVHIAGARLQPVRLGLAAGGKGE